MHGRSEYYLTAAAVQKVMQAETAKEDLLREKLALAAALEAARAHQQDGPCRNLHVAHRRASVPHGGTQPGMAPSGCANDGETHRGLAA
jgi:hypothetical protein